MISLVADTNILIGYFFAHSTSRRLIDGGELRLFSPEYALEEIKDHAATIIKKAGLSNLAFKTVREALAQKVIFVSLDEYADFFKAAADIPDPDDIDFIALALKLKLPLWSNDRQLKDQDLVTVLSTEEMIKVLSPGE